MHRSRSRERDCGASVSRTESAFPYAEGNSHFKSRSKLLRTEYDSNCEHGSSVGVNSITLEFKSSSSKKGSGMPIKTLIKEEMPSEKHIKRPSTNLIARLMGLDTMPSPKVLKPLKEVRSSSKDFQDRASFNDCSLPSIIGENEGFKDVFEVVEAPEVEKQKGRIVKKGIPSLRGHEIDKAFTCQNFIDATSLSADEMSQRCKEHDDAKSLDSNLNVNLQFFHEPSKHLREQNHLPSPPHEIYPSILMASNGSPTSCQSSFRSEKKVDRFINLHAFQSQSFRKHEPKKYCHPSREHLCSLLKKLSDSRSSEKDEYCAQPTQIVILKPNRDKARKAERSILSINSLNSHDNLSYDLKFSFDEIMELNKESAHESSPYTAEIMRQKIKGSREISKRVAKQIRNTLASERKKISVAKLNDCETNDEPCTTSTIINGNKSQTKVMATPNSCIYGDSSNRSSCSTGSLVTRKAKHCLSERWKLTNHFQEMDFPNGSSTLAEMLAFSDNETHKMTLDTIAVKNALERNLVRKDFLEPRNLPLGISSRDGWKGDFSRRLPRSKSLPASSLIHENPQWNSRIQPGKIIDRLKHKKIEDRSQWIPLDGDFMRKKDTLRRNLKYVSKDKVLSDKEEITLIEREIHVSSQKLKSSSDLGRIPGKHQSNIQLPDDSIVKKRDVLNNLSVSQSNADISVLTDSENGFKSLQEFTKEKNNVKLPECDKQKTESKDDGDQLPATTAHCNISFDPVCSGSYKDTPDQPSPVSVLEVPFEEEEEEEEEEQFSVGCFEKISADLQELRMQLRLLKQESSDICGHDMENFLVRGDEDSSGDSLRDDPRSSDILQAFRDEEERDYSYVLDILINGDILKTEIDGTFAAPHLSQYPISHQVFDKLEKKYKSLDSWSRTDRMLLFDLANSTLVDIIEMKGLRQLKIIRDGLIEGVWQAVAKQIKDTGMRLMVENLDVLRWADFGEDAKELIGSEVENMLVDDLLDELAADCNR